MVDDGNLIIEQVDAAELTPGEFSAAGPHCVEEHQARTVVIDSLNGYQAAMPEEQALILHMHELLQYLNRQGATTFLTVAQHGLVGDMKAPVDVTYLADTVILLRYFEALGRVRRAISVIKKRTSAHEDTIREYRIGERGITLGEPLMDFQGVLRGVPELVGASERAAGAQPPSDDGRRIRTGADPCAARPRCGGRCAACWREARMRGDDRRAISSALVEQLRTGAGFALVTEEALTGSDLRALVALDRRAAGMVRLPVRPADPARRRAGAQSGSRPAPRRARQRHLPRAAVPSDDLRQPRAIGAARPPPAI